MRYINSYLAAWTCGSYPVLDKDAGDKARKTSCRTNPKEKIPDFPREMRQISAESVDCLRREKQPGQIHVFHFDGGLLF